MDTVSKEEVDAVIRKLEKVELCTVTVTFPQFVCGIFVAGLIVGIYCWLLWGTK